jgi:hypothetical protein
MEMRGVCGRALKPPPHWEGCSVMRKKKYNNCHDCQPDSGNPTVRDDREACGNVSYGGTRNPLYNRKGACRKLFT